MQTESRSLENLNIETGEEDKPKRHRIEEEFKLEGKEDEEIYVDLIERQEE